MSVILYTWELGGGLGHLAQFLPVAEMLVKRGHTVHLAVKDIGTAARLFQHLDVHYHQAPWKYSPSRQPKQPARTFAHILHNTGWETFEELSATAGAWRHLMQSIRPDLILLDHSPTAILAAQSLSCPKMTITTGFNHPLDTSPLPDLRQWMTPEPERLLADELQLLDTINRYQRSVGLEPLSRVTEIFSTIDEVFFATFPELDPYHQARPQTKYHGTWSMPGGDNPEWPEGRGKRILAYLKEFKELGFLVEMLAQSKMPVLVFGERIPPAIRQRCSTPTLRFVDRPVDLNVACREADVVIHHAGHATTAATLLAGTPSLLIPFHLEQTLTAMRTEKFRAAAVAGPMRRDQLAANLHSVLNEPVYRNAAENFARRYCDHDPNQAIEHCVSVAERLLTR